VSTDSDRISITFRREDCTGCIQASVNIPPKLPEMMLGLKRYSAYERSTAAQRGRSYQEKMLIVQAQ